MTGRMTSVKIPTRNIEIFREGTPEQIASLLLENSLCPETCGSGVPSVKACLSCIETWLDGKTTAEIYSAFGREEKDG